MRFETLVIPRNEGKYQSEVFGITPAGYVVFGSGVEKILTQPGNQMVELVLVFDRLNAAIGFKIPDASVLEVPHRVTIRKIARTWRLQRKELLVNVMGVTLPTKTTLYDAKRFEEDGVLGFFVNKPRLSQKVLSVPATA